MESKKEDFTPVTTLQRRILVFILNHIYEHKHFSPLKVLCRHFGWNSKNTAHEHLKRLRDKGLLAYAKTNKRSHRWSLVPFEQWDSTIKDCFKEL